MKIQCDVCDKAQATVMCCADEAALCADCDTRVHAANKLASKHQRVSLISPSSEAPVSCDICQEKTGYFFCLEDRALLCRNCDLAIHSANAFTSKHKRFLVTGVRVALNALDGQDALSVETSKTDSPSNQVATQIYPPKQALKLTISPRCGMSPTVQSVPIRTVSSSIETLSTSSAISSASGQSLYMPSMLPGRTPEMPGAGSRGTGVSSEGYNVAAHCGDRNSAGGLLRRNTIAEYLTETLPGWRVDELLSLPDMGVGYSFGDIGSSKADTPNSGDADWAADLNFFDEQMFANSFAEVPQMPSPPTASGFSRLGSVAGAMKGKRRSDISFSPGSDDTFLVPDLGGQSSPNLSPSCPSPQKRRRTFMEI